MNNKTIKNKKVVTIVAVAFSIAMAFLILTSPTKQVDASTSEKYRTINGFSILMAQLILQTAWHGKSVKLLTLTLTQQK